VNSSPAGSGFPRGVAEQLGWYVYLLRDPLAGGEIFYAGKGCRDRVYQHAWDALAPSRRGEDLKRDRIRRILDAELAVEVAIVRHDLPDSDAAHEVEAAVIDALVLAGAPLTNLLRGHHTDRGYAPVADLHDRYAAPPAQFEATLNVLLVQLRQSWRRDMPADQLYERTRGWWVVGANRERVNVICGASDGIIRSVYRVSPGAWQSVRDEKGRLRWQCEGTRDEALWNHLIGADVRAYLPATHQSAVRYLWASAAS